MEARKGQHQGIFFCFFLMKFLSALPGRETWFNFPGLRGGTRLLSFSSSRTGNARLWVCHYLPLLCHHGLPSRQCVSECARWSMETLLMLLRAYSWSRAEHQQGFTWAVQRLQKQSSEQNPGGLPLCPELHLQVLLIALSCVSAPLLSCAWLILGSIFFSHRERWLPLWAQKLSPAKWLDLNSSGWG